MKKGDAPQAEESQEKRQRDLDGAWKDLIHSLWAQFIQRTLPELYAELDLSKPPEFLSQELRDPLPEAEQHNSALHVDELLKLYLTTGPVLRLYMKNGEERIVLLHTEIQGPGGDDVDIRMYIYSGLILAHYHQLPVQLAILTAPRPVSERKSLGQIKVEGFRTTVNYRYSILELYKMDDDVLLNSDSPIDIVFYAAKKTATVPEETQKLAYLRLFTRLLMEKGWSERERRDIFSFVTRVIDLRDELMKKQFYDEVKAMKEETGVESFIEKWFKDEGKAEERTRLADATEQFLKEHGMSELIPEYRTSVLAGATA